MAQIITDNQHYANIADAIREKNGETTLYKPSEMANAIMDLYTLNFEIVGGTTQPNNPRENTLWVNTSQEITKWCFSPTSPTEVIEGEIWFETVKTSVNEFSMFKDHDLMVAPIRALQYENAAWVQRDLLVFLSNAWVNVNTYLLNGNDPCTSLTGGWDRKIYGSGQNGTWSISSDGIHLNATSPTMCVGLTNFDPTIIKKFNTLKATLTMPSSNDSGYICLGISPDYSLGSSGIDSKWTVRQAISPYEAAKAELSVDISGIESGYPMITSFKETAIFNKIWLE